MKLSSKQLVINDPITWTTIALCVTGTVAALTLAECVFRLWYDSYLMYQLGALSLLYVTPILFVILSAVPLAVALKEKKSGFIVAICSLCLTTLVVSSFRGSHKWVGFQEQADESRLPYIVALILLFAAGYGVSRLLEVHLIERLTVGIIILSTIWVYFDAYRGLKVFSFMPFTRHHILAILVVFSLIAFAFDQFGDRIHHETT